MIGSRIDSIGFGSGRLSASLLYGLIVLAIIAPPLVLLLLLISAIFFGLSIGIGRLFTATTLLSNATALLISPRAPPLV